MNHGILYKEKVYLNHFSWFLWTETFCCFDIISRFLVQFYVAPNLAIVTAEICFAPSKPATGNCASNVWAVGSVVSSIGKFGCVFPFDIIQLKLQTTKCSQMNTHLLLVQSKIRRMKYCASTNDLTIREDSSNWLLLGRVAMLGAESWWEQILHQTPQNT